MTLSKSPERLRAEKRRSHTITLTAGATFFQGLNFLEIHELQSFAFPTIETYVFYNTLVTPKIDSILNTFASPTIETCVFYNTFASPTIETCISRHFRLSDDGDLRILRHFCISDDRDLRNLQHFRSSDDRDLRFLRHIRISDDRFLRFVHQFSHFFIFYNASEAPRKASGCQSRKNEIPHDNFKCRSHVSRA